MEDKILQIGKILNLSSTKTRGNTVKSIVESILYSYNEELNLDEIVELIRDIFNVEPFRNEIGDSIQRELASGNILSKNGRYTLNTDRYTDIYKDDLKTKQSEEQRFLRFKALVHSINSSEYITDNINILWHTFTYYLYECFYQYGENAVNHFRAESDNNIFLESNPFKNAIQKFSSEELKAIFRKSIILFIQKINHDDVEYLESLSKKTIAFHSLGLPKDLHDEVLDLKVIDWTIYVDTNFLYSVLNLHKHPENKACEDLLILSQKESLNIKFRYTPFTMGELKQKRSDFEDLIPRNSFNKSHISALLKSENLDSYSEAYYENLLEDSESTLHPADIIDLADKTLQSAMKIGLHNSKFTNITDDYLSERTADFERYVTVLNSARVEKGLNEVYKSTKQIRHDVFLREVIEYQQRTHISERPKTMAEVRFLGATLDKLLIKYDRNELSRNYTGYIIPNFHLPSFLLSKLYRFLPVQTDDYKKAFITAIATFSFSESTEKSIAVQKFVSYYRKLGLEDERLLLSFITDEFFLNNFFNDESDQDTFFESEINKKFSDIQSKYENAEIKLSELENAQANNLEEKKIRESRIKDQESVINVLKESEKVLVKEIKKINVRTSSSHDKNQLSILDVIEDNITKKENEKLKAENEHLVKKQKEEDNRRKRIMRDEHINKTIWQWRKQSWMILLSFVIIISGCALIELYICNWDVKAASINIKQATENNFVWAALIGLGSLYFNYFVIRSLYEKYHAHNNIKAYTDKIIIPEEMKET